ncbi:MAG: alpha/beta hydrolase [Actinomycetota bacterium]|nr:alpha/beta hydrolase [Actinomycetota bacterium]
MLHGLGSAGSAWWRIGSDLAARGVPSLAPDLRGHGGSPHPEDLRVTSYAHDVTRTCPDPWDLVIGHSLGGAVAVVACAGSPAFAQALLLVDPAIDLPPGVHAQVREDLTAEATDPPSVAELLATNPQWAAEDARRKHEAILATGPEVMQGTFDDNDPWDLGDQLADLDIPVHVLGADPERGALFEADLSERLRARKANLTFEVIRGAGHSVYRDDPGAVLDASLTLLANIPGR